MPVLTPDTARSTSNTWPQVRDAALKRATALPFPTADEEIWRYSRIAELDLAAFRPVPVVSTVSGVSEGVRVTTVAAGDAAVDPALGDLFVDARGNDLFGELNLAHMDVIVVSVARNTVVSTPIVITHTVSVRWWCPCWTRAPRRRRACVTWASTSWAPHRG